MKGSLIGVAVWALATFCAMAAATYVEIPENTVTNLVAADYGSAQDGTVFVAGPGATFVLPKGSGNATFYPHLVVSGGVVTVTCAEDSSYTRYRFVSGVRAMDGGSLVIGGVDEISIDRKNIQSPRNSMPPTGPLCDIDDLGFASGAGTLILRYNATVLRLPACPVRVASGDTDKVTTISLACTDASFSAPLLSDGMLQLTNFNATALAATALPDGCRVKVSPGYTFAFKPVALAEDGFSYSGIGTSTGRYDIELLGHGAFVAFNNVGGNSIRCISDIHGRGEILFKPESGTPFTRYRGVTYRAEATTALSIPVDDASDPVRSSDAWKAKVSHWFDASDADTLVPFTFDPNAAFGWTGATNTFNGNQIIIGWRDKVPGSTISLYNPRIWNKKDNPINEWKGDYVLQVMPYVTSGGTTLNMLPYLCFGSRGTTTAKAKYDQNGNLTSIGEGRRLRVWSKTLPATACTNKASGAYTNFPAAYCIMVFGSQNGGGCAILGMGTGGTALSSPLVRRNGKNYPWITNETFKAACPMYANGTSVTPGTDSPNGGWQVVSIDLTGVDEQWRKVTGLGNEAYNDSNCGGQSYAEVIFFSEKPTDEERVACERYLAAKWWVYTPFVVPSGSAGTVFLGNNTNDGYADADAISGETVEAFGVYSGTGKIDIPAGKTLLLNKPLPPTEADVPEENRLGWYDPDFPGAALSTNELAHTDLLWTLFGRTLTGPCDGANDIMYASGAASGATFETAKTRNFGPRMVKVARGLTTGPKRTWLVFKEAHGDGLGNMIRTKKVSAGAMGSRTDISNVKQAFFVTDTTDGGGSIVSESSTFSDKFKRRDGDNVDDPIWPPSNTVSIAKTWLDTEEVDGTTHGYRGRPEVLSFTVEAGFKPSYLAYYNGENTEVLGECIYYSAPLSDEARVKVQEYLMYKWFGGLSGNKYCDYTGATVYGAGNVRSPSLRNLPKFAGDYAGSVTGGGELSFTIAGSAVADPIAVGAPLVLDDGAAITVNFVGKPAPGEYVLLTANAITGSPSFTFAGYTRGCSIRSYVDSGRIWLTVQCHGAQIIFR